MTVMWRTSDPLSIQAIRGHLDVTAVASAMLRLALRHGPSALCLQAICTGHGIALQVTYTISDPPPGLDRKLAASGS